MRFKYILFAVIGLLVALFYALESFLSFQANGFTAPLLVKLGICGAGIYFFARSARRAGNPGQAS
jgi:hypothetical protein